MHFTSTLLAVVAAVISLTAATPVAEPQGIIASAVELCTSQYLQGRCTTIITPTGTCVEFPQGFHNDVSSVSSLDEWPCNLYHDDHCTSAPYFFDGEQDVLPTHDFNSVICTAPTN
ncbi:hypothetical protein NM688_g1718 [Phlebia brevispora]|uniref:Uncharacterized protein n=1 Tax=Phlebia brevispora TaxID=194682 RepID=A0ACC1TBC5_9APHY|nr:hypothetical protein NM688_g1718 [Phlebia brevispora]